MFVCVYVYKKDVKVLDSIKSRATRLVKGDRGLSCGEGLRTVWLSRLKAVLLFLCLEGSQSWTSALDVSLTNDE